MAPAFGPCVNCGKAARIKCTHCDEGVSVDGIRCFTGYCGTKCQNKDRVKHQNICKGSGEKKADERKAKADIPVEPKETSKEQCAEDSIPLEPKETSKEQCAEVDNTLETSKEQCAACTKPPLGQSLTCPSCVDGVDENGEPTSTIYCDEKCRNADAQKHASECNAKNELKEVYRAGEILQAVFYVWRETGFDLKIARVRKTNSSGKALLVVREGNYHTSDSKPYGSEGPFFKFPALPNLDEQDKGAILSLSSCGDAMGHLLTLHKKLLADITSGIWENYAAVEASDYYVQQLRHSGDPVPAAPTHQFLTVRLLTNGRKYVVDPAGAQYGQYQAVVSPARQIHWMTKHVQQESHGTCLGNLDEIRSGAKDATMSPATDCRVWHVQHAMSEVLNRAVEKWEKDHNQTLRQVLCKGQKDYAASRADFLNCIRAALQSFVSGYRSGAIEVEIPEYHDPASDQFQLGQWGDADIVGTPAFFERLMSMF